MAVVQGACPGLTHKLGTVGGFHANIFLPPPGRFSYARNRLPYLQPLYRAHGKGALYMSPLGFYFLLKFQPLFTLPVSGSEAVSIRSFFREGRRASASSSFFSTHSALRLAWVVFYPPPPVGVRQR